MSSDPNQPVPPSPQPLPGAPIAPPTTVKKKSGCVGCLLGCLLVIVLGVLAIGGLGYLGIHEMMKKTDGAVDEFKTKGFEEEKSEFINKVTPIQGKKLLHGSYMTIVTEAADSELAIVGVIAVVNSKVRGNLYFRGGVLVIGADAAIYGDVDVDCYNVIVQGYVQGQVKGKYQRLDENERKKTPPAPAGGEARPDGRPAEIPKQPPTETPQPPPTEPPPAPPTETPPPPAPEGGEARPSDGRPPESPPPPPPPSEPQPNAPDQQPPADSPAPQAEPPAEPTPTDPKPIDPAPTPPDPAPPSGRS